MRSILGLWRLLRRRGRHSGHPEQLTSALAVTAFTVATAALLVVGGGVIAFVERTDGAGTASASSAAAHADQYPTLALIAAGLLLIPLVTLGGAAARLAVARRDARLATLRLTGATNGQVIALASGDAVAQAATGALLGAVGYVALIPAVAQLRFQGRTFDYAELWVGLPIMAAAVALVVLVALVSSLAGLRRVAITPLGVAARTTPPSLRARRVAIAIVVVAAYLVASNVDGDSAVVIGVLATLLVLGLATLNAVGPFVIGVIGRRMVARARSVATLLAGRRIVDSPKTAWRCVGGVALATFIAGLTSVTAALGDPGGNAGTADEIYRADLATGGLLTLGIAGILAAVSAGVMQAGRIIDQRDQYRALVHAGTDVQVLHQARGRETSVPLLAAVGIATAAAAVFIVPVLGTGALTDGSVIVRFLLCVAAATAVTLAGSAATRPVVRTVLA
ncbi:FtsX-like permease family protein [Phytoactinopolyspora halotolerans]|uniref:ABC3 transporter permease C-terminal domain-containing protein n=1 Tax=Phytoactinopolyspora halotolerans TaxID=1981512 RepID=A0A6L9S6Z6_9ACTN|nr:FtsX-like permease family protein [Phytoactinopolyspora halotolerans]NEE00318.1 hypothetical protein [Phytoactinopolyspora halotolerans]